MNRPPSDSEEPLSVDSGAGRARMPPAGPAGAVSGETPIGDPEASGTGRKFPCPGCGAKLDFNPLARSLKCDFCGYSEKIDPSSSEVVERDWQQYWANSETHGKTLEGRSSEVQCRACAAVVLLEDKIVTEKCPYCGNDLENKPVAAHDMILPEGILPFKIDGKKAAEAFRKWIKGLWFAPWALLEAAEVGHFAGVYVPCWTYDSQTFSQYRGERGDNYTEYVTVMTTETYFEPDGKGGQVARTRTVPKTQPVVRIRWSPASGRIDHFFDDVLICASKSIPLDLLEQVGPWDLKDLEPFHPRFLAGFQTERYTVDLKEGFTRARQIMDDRIRGLCLRDIGGDHQRLHSVNTQYAAITFKHVLQPLWLAPYRFQGKSYRLLVNGRNGKVAGTRPYSFWKILLFILMILAIVGAIVGIAMAFGGAFHARSDRFAAPPSQMIAYAAPNPIGPEQTSLPRRPARV